MTSQEESLDWTNVYDTRQNTEQNRLALRVTGGQPGTTVARYFGRPPHNPR